MTPAAPVPAPITNKNLLLVSGMRRMSQEEIAQINLAAQATTQRVLSQVADMSTYLNAALLRDAKEIAKAYGDQGYDGFPLFYKRWNRFMQAQLRATILLMVHDIVIVVEERIVDQLNSMCSFALSCDYILAHIQGRETPTVMLNGSGPAKPQNSSPQQIRFLTTWNKVKMDLQIYREKKGAVDNELAFYEGLFFGAMEFGMLTRVLDAIDVDAGSSKSIPTNAELAQALLNGYVPRATEAINRWSNTYLNKVSDNVGNIIFGIFEKLKQNIDLAIDEFSHELAPNRPQ